VPHSVITPADAERLGQPVRRFIADSIIPLEQEALAAGLDDKLRVQPACWLRKPLPSMGEAGPTS